MENVNPPLRRRALVPSEWICPGNPGELRDRLAQPFRADWEWFEEAAAGCDALTLRSVGAFRRGREIRDVPRALIVGPKAGGDPIRLALFAGLGGNDPLARQALIHFLVQLCGDPSPAAGFEVFAYPVPDPGTTEEAPSPEHGRLAREFWSGSQNPAVYLLERELGVFRFHGVVVLGSVPRLGRLGIHLDSPVLSPTLGPALSEASDRARDEAPAREEAAGACIGDAAATLVDSPELPTRAFGLTLCLPALVPQREVHESVSRVLMALVFRYRTWMACGEGI